MGWLSEPRQVLHGLMDIQVVPSSSLLTMATFVDNLGTLTDDGGLHISHSEIKHLIHKVDIFDSNRIIDVGFVRFMAEGVNKLNRKRT